MVFIFVDFSSTKIDKLGKNEIGVNQRSHI